MVIEHGILCVKPGQEAEFESAFAEALPLVRGTEGFQSLEVARSIESPNEYLLLIRWDSVEAHVENFRNGPNFGRWRELLHHFYEPKPVIEHFSVVHSA